MLSLLLGACMAINNGASADLWQTDHQVQIDEMLEKAKENNPHPYAVFDADNTIWKYDIEEGLLAWMSLSGKIQLAHLNPMILPLPIRENDTLFSYYDYLCDVDHSLGYLWAAQVFSGFSLGELKTEVDALMASREPMIVPMPQGETKSIAVPKIFPAQKELINKLQNEKVEVWVVSASLEEVVRMVVSDQKYGLHIPPERVIGVNLMLEKENGEKTVGAIERKEGKEGTDYYFSEERMRWKMGAYPFAPLTWYAGKVAAISEWIDPSQRPILVAGDSPNDFYMQFYSAVEEGGIRLRIHRKEAHKQKLEENVQQRRNGNANHNPSLGWIEVTAKELGVTD